MQRRTALNRSSHRRPEQHQGLLSRPHHRTYPSDTTPIAFMNATNFLMPPPDAFPNFLIVSGGIASG